MRWLPDLTSFSMSEDPPPPPKELKVSQQDYLLLRRPWCHSLVHCELCVWESIGYEGITVKTGCASFQIAVLHNLIIPTTDGWFASDDFIPHWLAVALLKNANVLSLSDASKLCSVITVPGTSSLEYKGLICAACISLELLLPQLRLSHKLFLFFSVVLFVFYGLQRVSVSNCTLQNIHTSNTDLTTSVKCYFHANTVTITGNAWVRGRSW